MIKQRWFIAGLLLTAFILSPTNCTGASTSEVRKLIFPAAYSMGNLSLNTKPYARLVKQIGHAQGAITVTVPSKNILQLELSPSTIEHPERLSHMSTVGIDRLKLAYMSVEDDDHSSCDKALTNMPVFDHPVQIECTRSDLTDAGLLNFKSLGHVTAIDCFWGGLKGNFLKESKKMPDLAILRIPINPLNNQNLRFLKELKSLKELILDQCGIKDEAIKYIAQCSGLRSLSLHQNRQITDHGFRDLAGCRCIETLDLRLDNKITDASIETIAQMQNLKVLDLEGTCITAEGLVKLKNLKLSVLDLPKHYYEIDMVKLKKAFPKTTIRFPNAEPSREKQFEWSPLK